MLHWYLHIASRLRRDETGGVAAEYGLLVALIAVVMAAGATVLGDEISALFKTVAGKL